MTKRLIDGDVVEFAIDGQFGYVQRLGRHTRYGDAIVVYPRLLTVRVSAEELERCFLDQACFVVFFPLQLAVKERLGEIVASLPCRPMPKSLRRPRTIKPNGPVTSWFIDREDGQTTVEYQLSRADQELALGVIWNYEMLADRLKSCWTPKNWN